MVIRFQSQYRYVSSLKAQEPDHAFDQCRLAGAIGTEEPKDLPAPDRKADLVEGTERIKELAHRFDRYGTVRGRGDLRGEGDFVFGEPLAFQKHFEEGILERCIAGHELLRMSRKDDFSLMHELD